MLRNRLYYLVKPWLPQRLRLALRRANARRVRRNCNGSWPILESAGRKPNGWPGWPQGKQFALVLTHDVESQAGLSRVRRLAELEDALGFRSSFNFVPEGSYRAPGALRHWLTSHGFEIGVHDHHHDGKLFQSRERFEIAAVRINAHLHEWGAVGFRSGFMLHNLDWIHDLDIAYDASTFDTDPFEPQPDGAGTIFPFWVPAPRSGAGVRRSQIADRAEVQRSEVRGQTSDDGRQTTDDGYEPEGPSSCHPSSGFIPNPSPKPLTPSPDSVPLSALRSPLCDGERSGYVELPTTLVQDFNLFVILGEPDVEIWKQKTRWIASHGGMVLMNAHSDYLAFGDRKPRAMEYRLTGTAEYLRWIESEYRGGYWNVLPSDIAGWQAAQANHAGQATSFCSA